MNRICQVSRWPTVESAVVVLTTQLSFHGGIDMQHLLPHGTAEDVRKEVRRYCDVLGRDGGYILGPAHLFQPDVPPENILAVYQDAAP